jgi:hypothetical protein
MGVKHGNDALRVRLEQVLDAKRSEIAAILNDFSVPLSASGPARVGRDAKRPNVGRDAKRPGDEGKAGQK